MTQIETDKNILLGDRRLEIAQVQHASTAVTGIRDAQQVSFLGKHNEPHTTSSTTYWEAPGVNCEVSIWNGTSSIHVQHDVLC